MMPVTPLHFGLMAPINHTKPKKVSNLTFVLINIWIDMAAIFEVFTGISIGPWHDPDLHSFVGASIVATILSLLFLVSKNRMAYIYGAFLGAWSHILLDMLCHPEMQPFYPLEGNPFYTGQMTAISYALMPFFVWWLYQHSSFYRARVKTL